MSDFEIPRKPSDQSAFRYHGIIRHRSEGLQFHFNVSQTSDPNIQYDDSDLAVLSELLHEAYGKWAVHLEQRNSEEYLEVEGSVSWTTPGGKSLPVTELEHPEPEPEPSPEPEPDEEA